jgi:RNA polymerase sigma-70 factor (ECF subfamily)
MNKESEDLLADRTLVNKVLCGDTNAFSTIISDTERLVASIVFKMISNTEERKDIAQEIYLRAYKNLSSFKFQSKLSTWIGRIAFNTCKSHLEKKKLILFDDQFQENKRPGFLRMDGGEINIYQNETELNIYNRELSAILTQLIDELPVLYKTLITLFHHDEMSYAEIAQITELPEGTVKNYLFRARKTLRDNILHKYKYEIL